MLNLTIDAFYIPVVEDFVKICMEVLLFFISLMCPLMGYLLLYKGKDIGGYRYILLYCLIADYLHVCSLYLLKPIVLTPVVSVLFKGYLSDRIGGKYALMVGEFLVCNKFCAIILALVYRRAKMTTDSRLNDIFDKTWAFVLFFMQIQALCYGITLLPTYFMDFDVSFE